MLKSSLCESKDAYTLVSVTITITGERADDNAKQLDKRNEGVIYKSCAPSTDCTNEINNAQTDNAKDLDVMMMMFNLIEYNDNFLTTSGSLWQHYRDDPNDILKNSESLKFKTIITGKTPTAGDTKDVKIPVLLK